MVILLYILLCLIVRTVVVGIVTATFILNIFYLYLEYTFIREKQEDTKTIIRHNYEYNKTFIKINEALNGRLKVVYVGVFIRSFMLLLVFIGIITL